MRDAFIDVLVEVPVGDIQRDPDPTRHLYDLMRHKADQACAEQRRTPADGSRTRGSHQGRSSPAHRRHDPGGLAVGDRRARVTLELA